MKKTYISALAVAFALYCVPAFAQHGHGGVGGGGMGAGSNHINPHSGNGPNGASSAAASHGKTMDQILNKNTKLSDRIASLTGEPATQACSGFKNLGQCVAAAHVSKNLRISFSCLKDDMTGTAPASGSSCPAGTGAKTLSLGKSIQTLSPNANSKTESKKGQQEANQDLKDSDANS